MAKNSKKLTDPQFKIGAVVVLSVILILAYYAITSERFIVREADGYVQNPIISPKHPLTYDTEFCASKLTNLAHEIHFLEKDISDEERILQSGVIEDEEEAVVKIEQREITEIRAEFDQYVELCTQFDEVATLELCSMFLNDAKQNLDRTQEAVTLADSKNVVSELKVTSQDLRKAQRIYAGIKTACSDFE